MPIIGWGIDMLWSGNNWNKFKKDEGIDSESNIYRKNSYRVLLTRGRDGFIVFIPDEPRFNPTFEILLNSGLQKLN